MSKHRSRGGVHWMFASALLEPDATYDRSSHMFWRLDHVALDKWWIETAASAWQLLCLWNGLDPDPLGPNGAAFRAHLRARTSSNQFSAVFDRAFGQGGGESEARHGASSGTRYRQLLADADRVASAVQGHVLEHRCGPGCSHDLDSIVDVGDFHAWAMRTGLARSCDWPPRSLRGPEPTTSYVQLPVVNSTLRLAMSVARHFSTRYVSPWVSVPTYEEIDEYLRAKHGVMSERLAKRIAAILKPDALPRGNRKRGRPSR